MYLKVNVNFHLLVPTLILNEVLLHHPQQQKTIINLLSFMLSQPKPKFGKRGLIDWLRKVEYPLVDKVEHILKTTPMGNPAWGLFGYDPSLTSQLIKDLEFFITKVDSGSAKSLKSLIKEFSIEYPQYFSTTPFSNINWTSFNSIAYTNNKNILGDVITRLIMLQTAAIPTSSKTIPLVRPKEALYRVALRDLLIGQAEVDKDVWDEMVSLYNSNKLTNFLAFAPLLLQPFIKSDDIKIPCPTINTLATLMGNYSGATGSFMGEITRANLIVEWKTLNLTTGKLCEIQSPLPPVTSHEKPREELSTGLKSTTRIGSQLPTLTPIIGEDRGHILISKDLLERRWNLNLTDINNSLLSDKISFKKFPNGKTDVVFNTKKILICLNFWYRKQMKQDFLKSILTISGSSLSLPPTCSLTNANVNKNSVLPALTYKFRTSQSFDFFIAETYKEDKCKKEIISQLRSSATITISSLSKKKLEALIEYLLKELKTLEDEDFKNESNTNAEEILNIRKELKEAFNELLSRSLPSFNYPPEVDFRYHLGDEELLAIDMWFKQDTDNDDCIPMTRAQHKIYVALTFIWCSFHYPNDDIDLWDFISYQKYPIIDKERNSILSLIPYLFWLTIVKKDQCPITADIFRQKKFDTSSFFVPSSTTPSRISKEEDEDKDEDEFLPKLPEEIRLSKLSLCTVAEFNPASLLKKAEKIFKTKYSPHLHPSKTALIRRFIEDASKLLIKRLSNKNLCGFLVNYYSKVNNKNNNEILTINDAWELFKNLRNEVKEWVNDFKNTFHSIWMKVGDEWFSSSENDGHDNGIVVDII